MRKGGEIPGSASSDGAVDAVALERFRTVADAVDDGLFQTDAEGRIVDVNDVVVEAVGTERERLVGEPVAAVLGDVDAERAAETISELRESGENDADLELLVGRSDGPAAFGELRLSLVEYDGEYRGYAGVLRECGSEADRGLQESERRFESLVDGVEEYAIFMLDPDGRVVTWNEGASRLKGYEEEEIVGEHFSTFYTDEDREAGVPAANLDAALSDGSTEDVGWRVRSDGGRFWANVTITAIRDDDGTLQGFAKVTRDMTDRREREEQLRRERAQTSKLLQTAPVAITVYNADGDTVMANRRAHDFLGLSDGELLDELDDDEWDVYDAFGDRLSPEELPQARVLDTGEPVVDEEIAIDRPDGERKWFRVNATPLHDQDDGVDRVVSAGEDITELKRRERELRRRKDELETELGEVFGRISDGFFALDEEFRFTHINDQAHELINPEQRELLGKSIWDEFPEATERKFKTHYERAMEGQETVAFEEYYPEPIDTWFEVRAYPSETGLSVYFRDVTERKERERELEWYERVVENLPVGVYRNTPGPDGEFVEGNSTLASIFGADSLDELREYSVSDLYPDPDRRAEFSRKLEQEGAVEDVELKQETPDGRTIWISITAVRTEEDGEVYFDGIVQDVTERKKREQELRRQERRFEATFEDPNILVGLLEPDGTVLDINQTAMEYIDADLEDVTGEPFWETPWWGEGDSVQADVREWTQRAAAGEYVDFEADLTQPSGERYTLNGVFRPVTNDDGDVVSILVSDRDITERKKRERELEESERRYRTMAEYFPNGIVTLFDNDLRYTLAAGQGFDGLAVGPDDLEGKHFRDVWDDDTAEALEPAFLDALDGKERSIELEYAGRDWIFQAVPITDERGEVFAGMTLALDITERKRRERELTKYETIVETVDDGIYVKDEDGRFTMVNEAYAELTGYDREELVGEHASMVVDEATIQQSKAKIAETDVDAEPTVEAMLRTADGERVPAEGTFATLPADDSDREEVGVVRDITERKRRERQLEESRLRYQTLVENVPTGAVALVDENLQYSTVGGDPAGGKDISADDLEGRSVREALSPELADVFEPRYRAALEGEASEFEFENDGTYAKVHTIPVRDDDGDVFAAMGMSQDLTEQKKRERALERSERRYRTLVENFPNGAVGLFDEDLEYTVVGGELLDDPDISTDDLVGTSIRERFSEEELETLEPKFHAALDGESSEFEFRAHDRDLLVHTLPVRDADGEVFAGMVLVQDITQQKERERYFRDAKAQLEAAAEAGAVGTWEWYIDDDEFVAGASLAQIFGVDPDDAREGVSLDKFIQSVHEEDRDHVEAKMGEAVETCGEYEAEYRVRNADDELRWVVARGHVETDENGDPVTLPGAITDITERKRAEQEIREQRRQLETLFQVLPVGVVVADEDGRFVDANETAKEIWGGDVFDADSTEAYDRLPTKWADTGEPVQPDEYTMSKVLDGQEVTDDDVYEIEAMDGRTRIVAANGMPVRNEDGDVIRGVITLADITERREYRRKLEASNERLEQFAYAASHDLQEPLRMVSSYLSLIERRYGDALDEDGEEFLEFAVDGAERMRDMIDALLEYSRVETQGDPFEPVELEAVFEDALDDLQVKIAESDAEITAESLPRVHGDGGQLRQVVQNLLSNAIEYSGEEPPRIHVGAERDGTDWIVSVRDEGIGIDPEHADSVFEVFNRLHTQDEHAGTGIGLALCRRIVERHGGRIWVESEPGDGTTFYFTVPAEGEDDD